MDRPPDVPGPRRVMTAPVSARSNSTTRPQPRPDTTDTEKAVETLYTHPSVRIISFNTAQRSFIPSKQEVPVGSLPASSQLERTIAAGAFRIYRAPSSIAFLSCGSVLQPILPKSSQCWCINEDNSRFVLQIRRPQYWRIELPVDEPEDAQRADLLRQVFDSILLFEKTECPFQRSFTVALPATPSTPVKKKAWTAEGKHLLSSLFEVELSPPAHPPAMISRGRRSTSNPRAPFLPWPELRGRQRGDFFRSNTDDISTFRRGPETGIDVRSAIEWFGRPRSSSLGAHTRSAGAFRHSRAGYHTAAENPAPVPRPVRRRSMDSSIYEMQDSMFQFAGWTRTGSTATSKLGPSRGRPDVWGGVSLLEPRNGHDDGQALGTQLAGNATGAGDDAESYEGAGHVAPVNLARKRVTRMLAGRSYTAPSQSAAVASAPTKSDGKPTSGGVSAPRVQPRPVVPSQSSSASTDSFYSAKSSSYGSGDEALAEDDAVTPKQTRHDIQGPESFGEDVQPKTSGLLTSEDVPIRRRSHTTSLSISRPALSPFPPAASLFSPPQRQTPQGRLALVRNLPTSLFDKTIDFLFGPPVYLVKLMLKVAAKIAAGEWRGLVLGRGEGGEQIPVQWDYYSDGEFSGLSGDDDGDEDNNNNNNKRDKPSTDHTSSRSDAVPRTDVRRRSRWTRDNRGDGGRYRDRDRDGHDGLGVD